MNILLDYLNHFLQSNLSEQLGWVLLHTLWQVTLIAGLYGIAALLLRNRSAALRYVLGCVAMVLMLLLPMVTYCVLPSPLDPVPVATTEVDSIDAAFPPIPSQEVASLAQGLDQLEIVLPADATTAQLITPPEAEAASRNTTTDELLSLSGVSHAIRPWLPVASVVWLAGVLLLSLRPLAGWLHVRKLQRHGLSPLADPVRIACGEIMQRLGVQRAVQFAQSALVEVPTVVGYLRPMVLLPASAISGLTTAELELIVAHELAHIRRHDYLMNLAQTVVEALLFYHPGMWWVSSQVRRERENCCDDIAVAMSGDRATYIRALAQLEEQRATVPALAATGGSLLVRVRRLLGQPQAEFGYRNATAWLAGVIAMGLVVAALATGGDARGQVKETADEVAKSTAEDDETANSPRLEKFGSAVGREVAQVIRKAKLPFIDEAQLKEIEDDFRHYVDVHLQTDAYTVSETLTNRQRDSILAAIRQHGAKHLRIDRFQPDNLRSLNLVYLGLPDRLLTLKWKLYRAINNVQTLTPERQATLDAQRLWMQAHIKTLPGYRSFAVEKALAELDARFADPLCCTLGYPMKDKQFDNFQQQLQDYPNSKEVIHVVSHIVQESLSARFPNPEDFLIPCNDKVFGHGAGRFVHLDFVSNRPHVSSLKSLSDVEASATLVDATTGNLLTAPEGSREPGKFRRWVEEKGQGDFGFDEAQGGGLFAARGAKLVKLPVRSWVEADAISNKALRALLESSQAGRVVLLQEHYQDYLDDNGAPYCYVGVLTKEGRLAVVAVEGFSGRSNIGVRTRIRSTLLELVTETLSDSEVTLFFDRPAHWVDRGIAVEGRNGTLQICGFRQPESEASGTIPTIKVQFEDYGYPYSVSVKAKRNPAATVDKILTVAGEPARLISFEVPGISGEAQGTRQLMRLMFGKGTRGYDLTFVYPTSQRQQYLELALAVGKSIRVRANEDEAEEVTKLPKGLEFLAGIPEFADLRLDMTEEQLKEIIARHDLDVQTTQNDEENTSSYTLSTPGGKTVIVMFGDGKCGGIQRMRDQLAWGDKVGDVRIALSPKQSLAWIRDQPLRLVLTPLVTQEGRSDLLLSTAQVPESRLKVDGILYRHSGEDIAGVAYSPSSFWAAQANSSPKIVLDDQWRSVEGNQPLNLKAGKYRVSYGWAGYHPDNEKPTEPDEDRPAMLWSGEVEVEIKQVDPKNKLAGSKDSWLDDAWHKKKPLEFGPIKQASAKLPADGSPNFLDLNNAVFLLAPTPGIGAVDGPADAQKAWAISQGLPFEFRAVDDRLELRSHDVTTRDIPSPYYVDNVDVHAQLFDKQKPRELLQSLYNQSWAAIRFDLENQQERLQQLRNRRLSLDPASLPVLIQFRGTDDQLGLLHIQSYSPATRSLRLRYKTVQLAANQAKSTKSDNGPSGDTIDSVESISEEAENKPQPAGGQLIGQWVGGGGIVPVIHTFSADGKYMHQVDMPGEKPRHGTWRMDGEELIRQTEGEQQKNRITWKNPDLFVIRKNNGNSQGYNRIDEQTGKVRLWGEAVDGISLRLAPLLQEWKQSDDSPVFELSLNNQSDAVDRADSLDGALLEIDGQEYLVKQTSWEYRTYRRIPSDTALEPFARFRFSSKHGLVDLLDDGKGGFTLRGMYSLTPYDSKTSQVKPGEFQLRPGKHTLRVALTPQKNLTGRLVYSYSNLVEIEIVASNTFRIGGEHKERGTIRGKLKDTTRPYTVLLEHELWENQLGLLPNLVVPAGSKFEFTNVPPGKCKVVAQPIYAPHESPELFARTIEVNVEHQRIVDLVLTKDGWKPVAENAEDLDSIRVSLRVLQPRWQQGQMPMFDFDLDNQSAGWTVFGLPPSDVAGLFPGMPARLVVDGEVYLYQRDSMTPRTTVEPSQKLPMARFSIDHHWRHAETGKRLLDHLKPGKHMIHASVNAMASAGGELGNAVERVFSNAVEIEIVAVREQGERDTFIGLFRGRLGGAREVTWRIVKHQGSYYWKEDPDAPTLPAHQKLTLTEGVLVAEDAAERFRFTPDKKNSGLVFEMWNKRTGESQGKIKLRRVEEAVDTEQESKTIDFHGLKLEGSQGISDSSKLPLLWEEVPSGSKSYEMVKDVEVVYQGFDGTVYYRPDKDLFYVQSDPPGSSRLTYYGPFDGNPMKVLDLPSKGVTETGKRLAVSNRRSLRGNHQQAGTIRGQVAGDYGPYRVTIEHKLHQDPNLLPSQLVKSGESFEFTGVPVGKWTITAKPTLLINRGKYEQAILTKQATVGKGQTVEVFLRASNQSPIPEDEQAIASTATLTITKDRGGQASPGGVSYSLDGESIALDKLQQRLKEELKTSPELRLVIRADPELPYSTVAVAMQLAKAAGVENVVLKTEDRATANTSAAATPDQQPFVPLNIQTQQDGGSVGCTVMDLQGNPLPVCFDQRDIPPVAGATWQTAGNRTFGRVYKGADSPSHKNAKLVELGSFEEQLILKRINSRLKAKLSPGVAEQMLVPARSSRFFNRLSEQTRVDADELRGLTALLKAVRQYERVFVQSHGVNVQLSGDPQQPDQTPTYQISAINRGENDKLVLGRTDQAFELEVDGKWHRQAIVRFKSSLLPPGRIYDAFPLTLDKRWQHEGKTLELSPGKHTIRVRCQVHPFPSNPNTHQATSNAVTVWISSERAIQTLRSDE